MPQPQITEISFKITYLKFRSNLPGANELTNDREASNESCTPIG